MLRPAQNFQSARTMVKAIGVFVDEIRRFHEVAPRPLVTVSQDAHLVLRHEFLPGSSALVILKTADGRLLFAMLWRDRVVVGATETPGVKPLLELRARPEDIAFTLEHARKYSSRATAA